MISGWVRTASASALLAMIVACAGFDPAPPPSPSPRPECSEARVIVYFTEDSATLQPTTGPLLRDLMDRINACRSAGGELRAINVTAHPDRRAGRAEAEAEMRTRSARVRAVLVEAGAPDDVIRTMRPRGEGGVVMQRRAEILVDQF